MNISNSLKPDLKKFTTSEITGIIFSKDRALQLDAGLRSFFYHCQDHESISIKIIYTCSDKFFANQYHKLEQRYPSCRFIKEENFKTDLLAALKGTKYVLFLVDDNIFIKNFAIQAVIRQLIHNSDLLAFSLRLGRNTKNCYILNTEQSLPDFTTAATKILHFNWTNAEGDFGFPLEVSSSIYRVCDLLPLIQRLDFNDPNTLELYLSHHKYIYEKIAPKLACFNNSVTFCNPVNIVNSSCICRAGDRQEYSSLTLAKLFEQGLYINIEKFNQFIPNGCHQEVELSFSPQHNPTQSSQQLAKNILNPDKDNFEKALDLRQTFMNMGLTKDANNVFSSYLEAHPEDSELVEAALWWQTEQNTEKVLSPRISVVIPAYNCAETICNSLNSITQAFTFCMTIIGQIEPEIVVVNDNSPDNTLSTLQKYQQHCPYLKLTSNPENIGAGPSRNLGVRLSQGEFIFFLDGDDLFHREHIFLCLHQMFKNPALHFVQTGIRIDETILPYWKNAIANSVPFNLCVRRWCHDCIGGYPEGDEFIALRCEDAFYRVLLSRYFMGFKIKRETMQHFRYPGNALDRQMGKFSKPPSEAAQDEAMSAQELAALPTIQKLMETKNLELKQRLTAWLNKLKQ